VFLFFVCILWTVLCDFNMSRKLLLTLLFLLVFAIAVFVLIKWSQKNNLSSEVSQTATKTITGTEKKEILVGPNKLLVEIAGTNVKRAKGLGGRDSLGENEGMLFIFEKPDYYSFWMKDMKIPLDFIWISGNEIKDITKNIPPPKNSSDRLQTYRPIEKVDKVLEVNSGWVESHNVKIGDEIRL